MPCSICQVVAHIPEASPGATRLHSPAKRRGDTWPVLLQRGDGMAPDEIGVTVREYDGSSLLLLQRVDKVAPATAEPRGDRTQAVALHKSAGPQWSCQTVGAKIRNHQKQHKRPEIRDDVILSQEAASDCWNSNTSNLATIAMVRREGKDDIPPCISGMLVIRRFRSPADALPCGALSRGWTAV